jgi:hypothetical protein
MEISFVCLAIILPMRASHPSMIFCSDSFPDSLEDFRNDPMAFLRDCSFDDKVNWLIRLIGLIGLIKLIEKNLN